MSQHLAADAWGRLERRAATWQAAAIAVVVLVVAWAVVEHVRDRRRDAELARLHGVILRDSTARVAAVAKTDSSLVQATQATASTAHAEDAWSAATRRAATVPAIVAAPVHDTIKIRELVATVDTLRLAGDSLARAAAADTIALQQLHASIIGERAAWQLERTDLARALQVSEARHRHWGLGATLGYGALRDNAGVVHVGPTLNVGVTYRW